MRSEKREKKPAPSPQRQQKQQLFERKKKPRRVGRKRAEKRTTRKLSAGVKRAGPGDLGDQLQKKLSAGALRLRRERRCPARPRAQFAGGRAPSAARAGGTGRGHRPWAAGGRRGGGGAGAAGLSPTGGQDPLLSGVAAAPGPRTLACASPAAPDLRRSPETRGRKEEPAAAVRGEAAAARQAGRGALPRGVSRRGRPERVGAPPSSRGHTGALGPRA